MLCQRIGVNKVFKVTFYRNLIVFPKIPERILKFICDRAHSNPFVATEILLALRNRGALSVEGRTTMFS